jgi:transcription elongation factor Elf1
MTPRKDRYQTPEYIAQGIRAKRKKLLYGSYSCPKCKQEKLQIQIDKEKKAVTAICGCGLNYKLNYVPAFEAVDYYNKFVDHLRKG